MTSLMPGQRAVITRVDAGDQETERLMAMGICGGRTVQLVQVGDPLIMKVYGTRVGVSARLSQLAKGQPPRAPPSCVGSFCPAWSSFRSNGQISVAT